MYMRCEMCPKMRFRQDEREREARGPLRTLDAMVIVCIKDKTLQLSLISISWVSRRSFPCAILLINHPPFRIVLMDSSAILRYRHKYRMLEHTKSSRPIQNQPYGFGPRYGSWGAFYFLATSWTSPITGSWPLPSSSPAIGLLLARSKSLSLSQFARLSPTSLSGGRASGKRWDNCSVDLMNGYATKAVDAERRVRYYEPVAGLVLFFTLR